jgi:hypothetical protein
MRAQKFLLTGLLVTGALFASGCVEDNAFYILQNQVPGAGCTIGTTTTTYNPQGTLDISGKQGYTLFPLMVNNLIQTEAVDGQPERNRLAIKGFEVELDLGSIPGTFPSDLLDYFEPKSGSVDPGGGKTAGAVEIFPTQLVQMLNFPSDRRPLVQASVRAVGSRGGVTHKSALFIYPITLCNGCLVDFRDTCPSSSDPTIITNVCGLPQDSRVTCCEDSKTKNVLCYQTAGN